MPNQDNKQMITDEILTTEDTTESSINRYSTHPRSSLQRQKEKRNAWLLTLLVHLIIAGLLIGYWYNSKQAKPMPSVKNRSVPASATTGRVKTLSTESTKTIETSSIAASTMASSASSILSTESVSLSLPPVTFNAPTMYFFAESDESGNDIQTMTVSETPANNQQLPQSPTTKAKNPAHQTAYNSILTKRDIPQVDSPAIDSNPPANSTQLAKQAKDISNNIDEDNVELSRLINEVKTNNQRKIDADMMHNTEKSTSPASSP